MRRLILSEDARGWWYAGLALAVASLLVGTAAPAWAAPDANNTQISGVGIPGGPGDNGCDDAPKADPTYTIAMSGDLEGCIYGYELEAKVLDNGIFQTRDQEFFVGTWDGKTGTWEMREHFTSKWDPTFTEQKYGRCQHPIVDGSGTGDFEGITGRLDFKDDVDLGVANYRGHLKLES
ncbi:MAG: DUF3224 domain-containing protein [Acidimicrobiia bacterium]|nr:DUF3224 domain-containing protein [Acidimicrobiia bacterium]